MHRNSAARELCELIRASMPELLDESGGVLYSAAETLRPSDLYILGLNPGGGGGERIAARLGSLPTRTVNEYLDADWSGGGHRYEPGQHPFQKRLAWFVEALGYDLRSTCASNLIFTRSVGQEGAGYPGRADACWPAHELVLSIVQPRLILAIGNGPRSPYAYLRGKLGGEDLTPMSSGHGSWTCKAFRSAYDARSLLVLGIPHLSRYDIVNKERVVRWAQALVEPLARGSSVISNPP